MNTILSIFSFGGFTTVEIKKGEDYAVVSGETPSGMPYKLIIRAILKLWRKHV